MWFTKDDDGYRAWFTVEDKNGLIRTGGVAGNFVVTVVNPADTANTVPTVAESTQKPGLYTFLIPSSFFTTHGVGGYGVVVQVTFAAAPKVDAVFAEVLRVFEEDFDSVAGLIVYDGAIHIDTKNGSPGSTVGTNGTTNNPVDNLADAVTLAAALGFRRYELIGNITLTTAHDDWVFVGKAAEAAVNINNQDVADTLFINVQLSGNIGNGPIQAVDSDLDGIGNFTGHAHNCGLVNGTTLGAGTSDFVACYSLVPGLSTPVIDADGVGSINLRAYSGGMEIRNMSAGGQNASLEFIAGQAILAPSNTAGTVTLRGIGNLTDNSLGTTVESNAFLNIDAIWDEILDGTISARTIMTRVNSMARGRITLSGAAVKAPQDAVYYDETGVPVFTNRNTGNERNPL